MNHIPSIRKYLTIHEIQMDGLCLPPPITILSHQSRFRRQLCRESKLIRRLCPCRPEGRAIASAFSAGRFAPANSLSGKNKAHWSLLVPLTHRLICLLHLVIGALDTLFCAIKHPLVGISNLTANGFRSFLRWFILATRRQESHCGQGYNSHIHQFPHESGEVVTA